MSAFQHMKNDERRSVLEICLDVHMHNTGSGENPKQDRDVVLLAKIADNWEPSFGHQEWQRFDDAVLLLIRAAIEEHEYANGK